MPTTNPVPSNDPTDLLFNAQKLDQVVNGSAQYYTDRLGVNRRTMKGISAAADVVLGGLGYAPPVAYASGISLTLATQTVEHAGEVYAPKVASLPFTTSTWATDSAKFRLIQGVAATDLAAPGGSSMIGYTPAGTGAVATTAQSKLRESVSVKDFGAVGDGVTDDTVAIQNAINACGGRTLWFPVGAYIVSSPLTLVNGIRIIGEGSTTGATASAIKVNVANYSNTTFGIFTNGTGVNLDSVVFDSIRFLGGGYGCKFDLSSAAKISKISWLRCTFQENLSAGVGGVNAVNGSGGIFVCKWEGNTFISVQKGIYCSGAFNANHISFNSFDQMRGQCLHLANPSPLPSSAITFERNRVEAVYGGHGTEGSSTCIQLDGTTYDVQIKGNYFENCYTTMLTVSGCRGIVWAENFHTNDYITPGAISVTNSQVSVYDNYTLIGVVVTFSGTTCQMPRNSGNQAYSYSGVYTKMAVADSVAHLGNGGFSLQTYPGVYDGVVNKLKILTVPSAASTYFDVLAVSGGSSAVLGSRSCAAIRATLLLDAIDSTGGGNNIQAFEYLISVWGNAGGTMSSSIVQLGKTTPPGDALLSIRQKAGATSSALTIEVALTQGAYAWSGTNSKLSVLYSWVGTENNSSGISVA